MFINNKLPSYENCSVAIIGMGYVGLPLANKINKTDICLKSNVALNRRVVGFDLNEQRIVQLKKGIDKNNIVPKDDFNIEKKIEFTSNKKLLLDIDIYIITVPTPLKEFNKPDLSFLEKASMLVGDLLKNSKNNDNQIIIFESTVYPGATEEICIPLIEKYSNKQYNSCQFESSFYCGYSPERINPGDEFNTINSIIKVTSGCNIDVANWIDIFYGSFIKAGTFKVSNIRVAEAAKVIENTQRDINIALVNELAMLFKKMDINSKEVLEAASTKWNFHNYKPGLVGGHCIGIDPYYLQYKAEKIGFNTRLISAGRIINDNMQDYLMEEIKSNINSNNNPNKNEKRILLLGLAYKANSSDVRNSKLIDLVKNIKKNNFEITVVDPQVDTKKIFEELGIFVLEEIPSQEIYSIIIFALFHREFKSFTAKYLKKFSSDKTKIIDLTYELEGENIINL